MVGQFTVLQWGKWLEYFPASFRSPPIKKWEINQESNPRESVALQDVYGEPPFARCIALISVVMFSLSFGAESEREKREWMEALQNSIAETLYDYEVAEKIWSNKANRFCADCHALSPDWASVNLCVVICKQCAGKCVSVHVFAHEKEVKERDRYGWGSFLMRTCEREPYGIVNRPV